MTQRSKITDKMRKYLESRLNCENVIKFVDKNLSDTITINDSIKKLKIGTIPLLLQIINYNDENDDDKKNLQKTFAGYDFITEANYTGFEYFPYLYGVLNCHAGSKSRVYVFFEYFENTLTDLFPKIEHSSEWYDIIFQLAIINYYLTTQNSYYYDSRPEKYLYNRFAKPIYQQYDFTDKKFNINHKYLINLWSDKIIKSDEQLNKTEYIKNLLEYIEKHRDAIKIPPSGRIIKLLQDLQNSPDNTLLILDQYYNTKPSAPSRAENIVMDQ